MAKKLSDDELGALVDNEMRHAVGFYGGKLADMRRKAEYYFYGEAKGDLAPPEVDGRSSVVVPVVRNTIESMLPQLMVKFTGGDTVVEFEPTQREDEPKAKQATDYCNYLFFKKNNGHAVTYNWFKDALKLKRGIVKVWWDNRDEETREEYKGQTPVNLAMLEDDEELEIIEQRSYPDEEDAEQRKKALEQMQQQLQQAMQAAQQNPQAAQAVQQIQQQMAHIQQQPPAMLFDVSCKRVKSGGKISIENVPPEEFMISRKAKDIANAPFVGHRVARTMSELRSMGYSEQDLDGLGSDHAAQFNAERVERLGYDDEFADLNDDDTGDESQRRVWLTEGYMRSDYDGDGIAELRKICKAGGKILSNEVVDIIPFVSICPIPEPHKFFGLSIADLAMTGQLTETALLRSVLDNQYLEVNGRYFAVENQVNLDDLLSSRPGGVVRIKSSGAVGRLDQGKGNLGESMNVLEYMKGFNEDSTGWSRQSQGNDPSSLMGETATKANIVTNKADMRTDLVARNFAEGFVEMFRMILKLVTQHQDKEVAIRLGGEWVDMDPREWRNQFDVNINVGLGVGSKDQQIQHVQMLQNAQVHGMQIGIAKPEHLYNSSLELAKLIGYKSGDKFFAKPDPNFKMPDPGAAEMQAKMQMHGQELQAKGQMQQQELAHKAQLAQMEQQFKAQTEQADREHEAQLEQVRAQMQAQVDMNRDRSQAEQNTLKMQQDAQLEALKHQYDDQRHQREMAFEQWKVQMEMSSKERVAQITAESKIDAAELAANATLSAAQESASDDAVGETE